MTARHTAGLGIWVDGRRLPPACDIALAWAFVTENARTPAAAELGFRDPRGASLLTQTGIELGSAVKVSAFGPDGTHDLFEGEVTDCEARASADGDAAGGGVLTVIRALDHAHRLRRGTRVLAYRQMSAGQIAQKIADLAGVRTGNIDDPGVVYEFLTQPAMSDWDFLSHLARESGCDLFLRDGRLHFEKPARASGAPAKGTPSRQSPFALEFGENLLKVSSVASLRDQVTSVVVRGWDPERKQPVVAQPAPRTAPSRDVTWRAERSVVRGEPLLLAGLPRGVQSEAEHVAQAMAQEVAAGLTGLRAVVRGEPRLRLRSAVTLKGLGKRFDGRYAVTSVRHEFHPDSGYLTELTVDEGTDRIAAGRPGDGEAGLRRFHGVMPATVVNIEDEQKQGRVKLRLPWLSPDYESNWARTVQLGGSRGHGVVLPEVGDEVLVCFEQGCLDRPYVLGGLYNGVDKPVDEPDPHRLELVDGRGKANWRSFASKMGHRLELLDADREHQVGATLITGDNKLSVRLDQHKTEITLRSDGTVCITAEKGVTVNTASGPLKLVGDDVTVVGRKSIGLSAPQVDVKAKGTLDISGATAKLAGTGPTEITGLPVKIN
ncbi:VgrG-related protein [Streptomyces sp. ET3-23]|uniref:VgrG-related protein n=1 Tax=Streptomyces sp. ET3-23 TaxID=2885643 RepID=UPI001D11E73B|nr:VgrG-related protein [Streptomyces sp. ET3-23]MCC2274094.1 VgrG-related protein [Streptomyces sp. ET3-23]